MSRLPFFPLRNQMDSNPGRKLSCEEKVIVQEFRLRVSDLLNSSHDDYYLLRWLRARKFDLEKAEKMLREHIKFRKKVGWDTLLTEYHLPDVVRNYLSFSQTGFDKDGNIVLVCLWGKMDYKGIVYSLDLIEHTKALVYMIEEALHAMEEENRRTGKNAKKITYVVDCEGMKMQQILDKGVIARNLGLAHIFQAHFPEIIKCCYMINVPKYFLFWYNFVKGMLDSELIRKIKIYDSSGWRTELLEEIGADSLPAFYGGKITDPDGNPECRTMFAVPQSVPETYYIVNNIIPVTKDPEMTKVTVRERTYFNLKMQVKLPKHVIRWRFQTLYHDIRYGLYYVPEGVKPMPESSITRLSKSFRHRNRRGSRDGHELLLPLERIESHVYPEEGEFHCEKTGTYLLHFDNTFSWMTPKELYYKVEVLPASKIYSDI